MHTNSRFSTKDKSDDKADVRVFLVSYEENEEMMAFWVRHVSETATVIKLQPGKNFIQLIQKSTSLM
ncbi:unnamed protein product [Brugia timori]|uniref:PH domain-containing protein n=1 Tax=Brugia timori TaxID=42155 RepID=A0A0R3R4Q8_9BILA|nr:unnamed protein product [Brugia timori]